MSDNFIRDIQVGSSLFLDNEIEGKVIGYIEYCNLEDNRKTWREYRVKTNNGILWLSIDENYEEYSISYPEQMTNGYMDPIWRKVEEGTQEVVMSEGDVDVEVGDRAHFVEFEDDTEENIYSIESWDDGTEVSKGYYLDREEIVIINQGNSETKNSNSQQGCMLLSFMVLALLGIFFSGISGIFYNLFIGAPSIEQYIQKSANYDYVTSITGNEKQKAHVYQSIKANDGKGGYLSVTVDNVAKDIIMGIEGNTESVTENKERGADTSISIVTPKEYCLIYYQEGTSNQVLVQVSKRKYNFTSDNPPYRSTSSVTKWYRSHYYSSAYTKDVNTWKSTPSAYTLYNGPILHDLGNGYFDVYSNNIRQESIRRRNSSDGGINKGK